MESNNIPSTDIYWENSCFSSITVWNYMKLRSKYKAIEKIDYNDKDQVFSLRSILQNDYRYRFPKKDQLRRIKEEVNKARYEIFNFLDAIDNPYEVLFTPFFERVVSGPRDETVEVRGTGFNEDTKELSRDYALYKLGCDYER